MAHPDEELLVLLALGEDVADRGTRDHVSSCPQCSAELESLRLVVDLGREGAADRVVAGSDSTLAPPSLWQGIADRLHLDPDVRPPGAVVVPTPRSAPGTVAETPPRRLPAAEPVTPARQGRRRTLLLAAAAVVLAVAGVGAGVLIGRSSVQQVAAPTSSSAQLAPVGTGPGEMVGEALVTQTTSGTTLTVSTQHLPLRTGFYQVWLYDRAAGTMVPIGTLDGTGRGTFTVTPSIDLRKFNTVDISAQELNGNPAHGTSMLQGTLTLR